jgi:serine/threonine-protein kinase
MAMAATDSASGALGKYQLIAELGHGGMAQVFLALVSGPAGFNKLVVIKQIRPQFAEDPEFLSMFLDEARLAARLNHPNVVQTNEVGEDGGRYFISMEYLEGQPLNRVLSRLGERAKESDRLSQRSLLLILVDALAGLHHAHELCDFDGRRLEVVHRDMSPHNIFVTYAGQVKVVDFGIAKALSSSSETRTGVLKGKIGYMAPEQAMGEKVDRRADIFSCGMILWEMLTGRRMFKGVPDVAVLQKIVNGDVPSPRTVVPDLPARLEEICMKALARDREKRFETAAEMASEIEAALAEAAGKGSLRDVGKMLETHFDADRQRIKQLVEAHHAGHRTMMDEPTSDGRRIKGGTGSGLRSHLPVIDAPESMSTRRELLGDAPTSVEPASATGATRPSPSSLTANMTAADLNRANAGKSRLVMAVGIAVAVGAGLAFALLAARKGEEPKPVAAATSTATAEASPTRTLRIESSPPGATVMEGAAVLGKTPLDVPLDPAAGTRHLVITLDGYNPYALVQEPTKENVKLVVPLVPVPAAAKPTAEPTAETKAAKVTSPQPRTPPPPPPPAKTPPPAGGGDINMTR